MPTPDATASGNTGTATAASLTVNLTIGAGANPVVLACISIATTTTVTGVTYNSVALAQAETIAEATNTQSEIWRLTGPTQGSSQACVASFNPSIRAAMAVRSYLDVHQTTPVRATATNAGNSVNALTVTISSNVADLCVDCCAKRNSGETIAMDTGQTASVTNVTTSGSTNNNIRHGSSNEVGAASVVMGWSHSGTARSYSNTGVSLQPPPVVTTQEKMAAITALTQSGGMIGRQYVHGQNPLVSDTDRSRGQSLRLARARLVYPLQDGGRHGYRGAPPGRCVRVPAALLAVRAMGEIRELSHSVSGKD